MAASVSPLTQLSGDLPTYELNSSREGIRKSNVKTNDLINRR